MTIKESIIDWNVKFPYDYLWRKKYQISFNSLEHRSVSQIDIYFEMYEEYVIQESSKKQKEKEDLLDFYKSSGKWLRKLSDVSYVTPTQEKLEESSKLVEEAFRKINKIDRVEEDLDGAE